MEEQNIHHQHHHKTRKKKIHVLKTVVIVLAVIVVMLVSSIIVIRTIGKKKLATPVAGSGEIQIDLGDSEDNQQADDKKELTENQILYKGQVYERNTDMITILVMGIDKESVQTIGGQSWDMDAAGENIGGQADAQFLVLINPHTEKINLIAINRNSMVDVDVWNPDGTYKGIYIQQICLQHGYGSGGKDSCERQVKTVSRLFHGIPINAYAAIEMDAIPELNDAVGGVTVEVLEDIPGTGLKQGSTVTLDGLEAYRYLRYRDTSVFDSATSRLQRQKQYISAFAKKGKEQILADFDVALNLYQTILKYMVTDVDQNELTYLATEFTGYQFDYGNIYSLQGETMMGSRFQEFYVDDEALQDMIIELFYEPVN